MPYLTGYGAFVARQALTPERAQALQDVGGLRAVLLQVEWQHSSLPQRSVEQLRRDQAAAHDAGLAVWWWGWCTPTRPAAGRRPTGPRALERRLAELVAEVGAPAGFMVDAEVGGGWSRARLPELAEFPAAVRAAGIPAVGLTSHGKLTTWPVGAFDVGAPQLYGGEPITRRFVQRCVATWDDVPTLWPVLGASSSPPAEMRADLRVLGLLGIHGALWWTARALQDPQHLAAATPR